MTLQKKIESVFVITRNSIENHDIFHLMKYLNSRYVVLNIYYLVGNYVSHLTKNFNEIFSEIANTPFALYVLFVEIYLRMYFNLLKSFTDIVIENCLMNKSFSIFHVKALKQKYESILFLLYFDAGKMLLNYLNVIFSRQLLEHTFLTFRPGINYDKKLFKDFKSKMKVFCRFLKEEIRKKFSIRADCFISKKRNTYT